MDKYFVMIMGMACRTSDPWNVSMPFLFCGAMKYKIQPLSVAMNKKSKKN
jgi:hypothetical protein